MIKKTFKEVVQDDVSKVFVNTGEFADIHILDGKETAILVDDNEIIEREKRTKSNMDGVFTKQKLIYVKTDDFGPEPARGRQIILDGRPYRVLEVTTEEGIYAILMEANRSR